jgi:hypothetical protein
MTSTDNQKEHGNNTWDTTTSPIRIFKIRLSTLSCIQFATYLEMTKFYQQFFKVDCFLMTRNNKIYKIVFQGSLFYQDTFFFLCPQPLWSDNLNSV